MADAGAAKRLSQRLKSAAKTTEVLAGRDPFGWAVPGEGTERGFAHSRTRAWIPKNSELVSSPPIRSRRFAAATDPFRAEILYQK